MSVSSESQTVREFWLSPNDGGKDSYFEMINSDFRVADGQTVVGVYAQVENKPRDLFAMVNLNTDMAMMIGETAAAKLHQKYSAMFLGKQNNWVALFSVMALGFAGWIWYKTTWMIGVPAAIFLLLAADLVIRKIP